jgi:hypothetical protein
MLLFKGILILSMLFLAGCFTNVPLEQSSREITTQPRMATVNDSILHDGKAFEESVYKILFTEIKLSKKHKKIQLKGIILDQTTGASLSLCPIGLGKITGNKIIDLFYISTDSIGKFSITTSVDTNSVIFGNALVYSTTFYHIGALLK